MKTWTLSIAAAALAAIAPLGALAAPAATADSSAAVASGTAPATKDARALLNQRMRECKAMTGDEKKACQKDAKSVSKAKARSETGGAGK
jgi:hypothetical protein